ncbi:CaiB/BaiF CoA transferase family protein [Zwartia vadi]|uniref:CaiB/BaiF CoA transferase family protein n=1 Tax=Zwartia vadi TaxID=3058168 RepID=UPI0025B576C2|nr:CoA transferase [Zwartia vadi]MDN3988856.1 CoA transferase [Zwartia vadi]
MKKQTDHKARPGPLAGVRVIDTTSVLFGPYCTQLLGDLGADIVKVEGLDGDTVRGAGVGRSPNMSGVFMGTNRNKRSISIDMKTPSGKQVMLDLLKNADVFVTNIRRKALVRLGLDYLSLFQSNPALIHCSALGYGRGGAYEDRPAFDDTTQAISGLASLQEAMNGVPSYVATAAADKISGLTLALAIVAAIRHKDLTGEGQQVEVPMFETMVAFNMVEHLAGRIFDPPTGPAMYARTISKYRKPYRTSNGFMAVMPYNDAQWGRFFKLIGKPDLISDPRFSTMASRTENVDPLYSLLEEEVSKRSTEWWSESLEREDIPAVPVKSIDDLLADEHLQQRNFFTRFDHPTEGTLINISSPIEMSKSPLTVRRHAPKLGQDTREILTEIGYDQARLESLLRDGVIKESH